MVRAILCTGACVAASVLLAGAMKADGLSERARKLHFSSIVVDTHDDTTQRLLDGKFDLGTRSSTGSIDIPRMREGNVGAIFFSIWMPSKVTGPDAVNRAIVQIDAVREQVRKHPNDLVLATRSEEHTSELQSPCNLVCRLLLEKKKRDHDDATLTSQVDVQIGGRVRDNC